MNDLHTLGKAMRDALQGARETILDLKNARGSEAEGTDEEWVADIDATIAAFDKALAAPLDELARIDEMLNAGQGDDDGPAILPKFKPGMSVLAKVESCLHLLEKRRDVIAAQDSDGWRDDPSADERWNAGWDYAMTQLCAVLGVDLQSVNWDAATETLDGDVRSVIHGILSSGLGEDWNAPAKPAALNPDDKCAQCGQPRSAHGHENYEDFGCFSFAVNDTPAKPAALDTGEATKLVKRLREWGETNNPAHASCKAAADALEAAIARAEKAESENYELRVMIMGGEDAPGYALSVPMNDLRNGIFRERITAQEQLEAATRQRDDALARTAESERQRDEARGALRRAREEGVALYAEGFQLINAFKTEWVQAGAWSEWDQSIYDKLRAYLLGPELAALSGESAASESEGV